METRFYLNEKTAGLVHPGSTIGKNTGLYYLDAGDVIQVHNDAGLYYFDTNQDIRFSGITLPALVANGTDMIVCTEVFRDPKLEAFRELGFYKEGAAEAVVLHYDNGKNLGGYKVMVRGKRLEDVRRLFSRIAEGSIRPDSSTEGAQRGRSTAELQAENTRLKSAVLDAGTLIGRLDEMVNHFGKVHTGLHEVIARQRELLSGYEQEIRRLGELLNKTRGQQMDSTT